MATKKDLIEAQGFSRRRLLTAFTSGAPGGKELEPAKPLRAVAAGIALAAMVVLGGVFYGIMRPGLPAGWENNTLVLISDTGARYLSIDSVLYPVINTASARLLMPAGEFTVITTDRETIEGIQLGPTIGILGAPDDLPTSGQLVNDGWAACVVDAHETGLNIASTPVKNAKGAVVVRAADGIHVVNGELRYPLRTEDADAILRASGLSLASAVDADERWLNLFKEGQPLAPLIIPRAGEYLPGTNLQIGSVVHTEGSADSVRYLITANGELSTMSPLAYQLYLLGTGAVLGGEQIVSPADVGSMPTAAKRAGGADWPDSLAPVTTNDARLCAALSHDAGGAPHTMLATLSASEAAPEAGVKVVTGGGALIRLGSGMVALIDESATAFAIPGATPELIRKLGYQESDIADVPQAWMQFLPYGPELTVEAARSSPRLPATSP